jgi:hypothetical protein
MAKLESYTKCSKCGVEKNFFSIITPCKVGAHSWTTSGTRWVSFCSETPLCEE